MIVITFCGWAHHMHLQCLVVFVMSSKFKNRIIIQYLTNCASCMFVGASRPSASDNGMNRRHIAIVIVISALVLTVMIIAVVAMYKCWRKKKRQQDQARFLKLFEDGDDIEDELGLGP